MDLGVEVQFCMAAAHQLMMSLEWPSVTNARANGDGGLQLDALVYTSVLASMVGLGWSKDNLRTCTSFWLLRATIPRTPRIVVSHVHVSAVFPP